MNRIRAIYRIAAMITALGLLLCVLQLPAFASEPEEVGGDLGLSGAPEASTFEISPPECATAEDLVWLLAENEGGTVALTGDIVIDSHVTLDVSRATTILMGDFGIILESGSWASLDVRGPVHFEGGGSDSPLFTIGYRCSLILNERCTITATSDGAAAVLLEASWMTSFEPNFARISATGQDSAAIESLDSLSLRNAVVDAPGEGSTGVKAEYDVEILLSEIIAAGEAVASENGEIGIYGSSVSPLPEGCEAIRLRAKPVVNSAWKLVCPAGGPVQPPDEMGFTLVSEDYSTGVTYPVDWDNHEIDSDTPGEYELTGHARLPLPDLPADDLYTFILPVGIYDPGELYLGSASAYGSRIMLHFYPEYAYSGYGVLWGSEDDGETWTEWEIMTDPFMEDAHDLKRLHAVVANDEPELGKTYHFYLELKTDEGTICSNELIVTWTEDGVRFITGDRNHTGRNPDPLGSGEGTGDGTGNGAPDGSGGGEDGETEPPGTGSGEGTGGDTETNLPDDTGGETDGGNGSDTGDGSGTGGVSYTGGRESGSSRRDTDRSGTGAIPAALPLNEPKTEPVYAREPQTPPASETRETEPLSNGTKPSALGLYTKQELADLIAANSVSYTFIQGDMRLTVPAAALASLELEDGGTFEVELGMPEADSFFIWLRADGKEIVSFTGETFSVNIPYLSDDDGAGQISCVGEDGSERPAGVENGRLTVILERTGTYRIKESAIRPISASVGIRIEAEAPLAGSNVDQSDTFPIPAVAGGGAVILAAAGLITVRLRRRRNL